MSHAQKISEIISRDGAVILDLGCGPRKKNAGWIGIDMLDYPGVDMIGDVYEIIAGFPDNSVDEVHAFHFFEHLPDVPRLLIDLNRVLKAEGKIEIVVPHFSNAYYYSDYTHRVFFGLYSLSYMVKDRIFHRRVPDYQLHTGLELYSVKLFFKSALYINRIPRKVFQIIFNSFTLMKEWYEDSWSRNFPCYEIQYILVKEKNLLKKI